MFGTKHGQEIYGYRKDYVLFDLETTGLDTEADKIVEIGAIRVRDSHIVEEFSTLVNPECEIPQVVIDLHGITNEMTKDSPVIKEALRMFDDFIGEDILLGQNIRDFDLPIIWRECEANFGKTISNDYIDNLSTARIALPELESHSGKALGDIYGIRSEVSHRALYDCRATYALYEIVGIIAEEKLKDPEAIPRLKKRELRSLIKHSLLHTPEKIGIALDDEGWANVDNLISGIIKSQEFDKEMLEDIVNTDVNQRFSFNDDKTLIRAEK